MTTSRTLLFLDLQSATACAMRYGGRIEWDADFCTWIVTLPDHDDPVHGHNPLCGDPNCRECVRPGWADVVEVEGVAAR